MIFRIVAAGVGVGAAALLCAGTASADLDETPPAPSSYDTDSGGTIGNEQMGVSWGSPAVGMGYAAWGGGYRVEGGGWPVAELRYTGPTDSLHTITNYDYPDASGLPGVEQWGTYHNDLGPYDSREFREFGVGTYSQEKIVRWGSMEYSCTNDVCSMAN